MITGMNMLHLDAVQHYVNASSVFSCDGGLSLGSWCKIAELDWHPHINGDCSWVLEYVGTELSPSPTVQTVFNITSITMTMFSSFSSWNRNH